MGRGLDYSQFGIPQRGANGLILHRIPIAAVTTRAYRIESFGMCPVHETLCPDLLLMGIEGFCSPGVQFYPRLYHYHVIKPLIPQLKPKLWMFDLSDLPLHAYPSLPGSHLNAMVKTLDFYESTTELLMLTELLFSATLNVSYAT